MESGGGGKNPPYQSPLQLSIEIKCIKPLTDIDRNISEMTSEMTDRNTSVEFSDGWIVPIGSCVTKLLCIRAHSLEELQRDF